MPAFSARRSRPGERYAVIRKTRTSRVRESSLTCDATAHPSRSGRARSVNSTSGRSRRVSAIASAPLAASDVRYPLKSKQARYSSLVSRSASATTIRGRRFTNRRGGARRSRAPVRRSASPHPPGRARHRARDRARTRVAQSGRGPFWPQSCPQPSRHSHPGFGSPLASFVSACQGWSQLLCHKESRNCGRWKFSGIIGSEANQYAAGKTAIHSSCVRPNSPNF